MPVILLSPLAPPDQHGIPRWLLLTGCPHPRGGASQQVEGPVVIRHSAVLPDLVPGGGVVESGLTGLGFRLPRHRRMLHVPNPQKERTPVDDLGMPAKVPHTPSRGHEGRAQHL